MGSWRAGCAETRTSGSEVRAGETDRLKSRHRAPARPLRNARRRPPRDRRLRRALPPPAPFGAELPDTPRGAPDLGGSPGTTKTSGLNCQRRRGARQNLLYYLIAFAVGYREQTFRDLLKRLLDVILSPGNAAAGAQHAVLSISPVSGPDAGGTSVAVTGAGLSNTRSVKFGTQQAGFHIDSDHHLTVVSPAATSSGPAVITVQLRDRNLTGPPFTYQPIPGSE
jgi:hypothetical protein